MTSLAELERIDGKFPAYAWPGGYPLIYVTHSGDVLCADCATAEYDSGNNTNFDPVEAYDTHYEGPNEICANCNKAIPSAYGDPDDEEES